MADTIQNVNAQIIGSVSNINWANIIGWVVLVLLVVGISVFAYIRWRDNRLFTKSITAFEIVNGFWQPSIRDKAKIVKLGTGGFEILYLQKLKSWKIAYGGRVGKDTYYFFIMPDGYWYNGMLNAGISYTDKNNGLIQVTTTNPLMRGQYTSLEKQIDELHGQKAKFWDKYGSWVLGIGFVLIAGVMLWLCFKEFSNAMGQLAGYHSQMNELLAKVNTFVSNMQTVNNGANNNLAHL